MIQHKELAQGRWQQMDFVTQMANIGSEVERALKWKDKQNQAYSRAAFERALELLDFSLDSVRGHSRLKEVARVREALVDYFAGSNQFGSSETSWRNYFLAFTYAARKDRL